MRYAMGRVAYAASLMAATLFVSFFLFQLIPSDPARIALGANASPEQVAALRSQLGLDQPWIIQLGRFVGGLAQGDLGRSFGDGRPVAAEVAAQLAVSATLAFIASAFSALYVALQISHTTVAGAPGRFRALNGAFTMLPTMFAAIATLTWVFPNYPYNYYPGTLASIDGLAFLLPPALVLSLYPMGILGKVADREWRKLATRPFIEAVRARGLPEQHIQWHYFFPNALVTLLATYATLLPIILTGSFIVEIVFSVPGIGALLLKSVLTRDLPMLQGIVIATTMLGVAIHLVVELSYPLIDPRIADYGFD